MTEIAPRSEMAFAEAFAAALDQRGMSLSALRERLAERGHRVSVAALSYWRTGRSVPERRSSLEAVAAIEQVLSLAPGSLAETVVSRRRRRPPPVAFDALLNGRTDGTVMGDPGVDRVSFHLGLTVAADHSLGPHELTQVYVATEDGVDGVTQFAGPSDGGVFPARAEAVFGCTVGPTTLSDGVWAARLQFERPLRTGESVLTRVRVVDQGIDDDTNAGLVAEQRLDDAMVWVTFDPDVLPVRCWTEVIEHGSVVTTPLDLAGAHSLHVRKTDFGPGVLRVCWEW